MKKRFVFLLSVAAFCVSAISVFITPETPEEKSVSLLRAEHRTFFEEFSKSPQGKRDWAKIRPGQKDGSVPRKLYIVPEKTAERIQLGQDAALGDARDFFPDDRGRVYPGNLPYGKTYYWRSVFSDGSKGKIHTFAIKSEVPRWIAAPGLSNVRDIGGWKSARFGGTVKQELFYRGSEFDDHMKIADDGKKVLLDELKIKTDVDLRAARFSEEKGYHPVFEGRLRRFLFPIGSYAEMIDPEKKGEVMRKIFSVLADKKNYPLYIHCWGGADRTGTIVFLTECLLGLSDEDLFRDYELTSFAVFGERDWRTKEDKDAPFYGMLQKLDAYGKADDPYAVKGENFLRACGVTDAEIGNIRAILLKK